MKVVNEKNRALDQASFEALFQEHYAHLCAYACNFVRETPAAEEVVQEVFYKLWTKRESLNIETSYKAYLFRAVKNACLNTLQHIKVREEYKTHNEAERRLQEQYESDGGSISELEGKIRQSIEALPEQRRKIFILSRYEGLKYREIAEQLNLSVKTVENQMGKALQYLRQELAEYMPLILIFFHQIFKDG